MKHLLGLFALLLLLVAPSPTAAQPEPCDPASRSCPGEPAGSDPSSATVGPSVDSHTVVRGKRVSPGSVTLDADELAQQPGGNVGQALVRLPGVSGVRKSADTPDLVLRGLGGERVTTRVNGVPLHGACPSRMDPPVSYINPEAVHTLSLIGGVPSVTAGPTGIGGAVDVSLEYRHPSHKRASAHASARAIYDSARGGAQIEGALYGGSERMDLKATVGVLNMGDYTSSDGVVVPAGRKHLAASASLGINPAFGHRLWQGLVFKHEEGAIYPALPMDNIDTDFWLYSARYTADLNGQVLRRMTARFGLSRVDHLMDNHLKANRVKMAASTPARTATHSAGLGVELRPFDEALLSMGADLSHLGRDAVRTRRMVHSGATFADHVWPDAVQWGAGAYLELDWRVYEGLRWRTGARLDIWTSDALAGNDPSLGNKTVAQQYRAFYGEDADQLARTEPLASVHTVVQWTPDWLSWLALHLGGGFSMRQASITERFFAFGPAPGGYLVGNPRLSAEKKGMVELGGSVDTWWIDLRGAGYFSVVADHVLPVALKRVDINGDGAVDLVKGFRNVTAQLGGFELAATIKPLSFLHLPLSLAYTRGYNATDGRDLPEIPPFSGEAAVRFFMGKWWKYWAQVGVRFAAAQTLVDEAYPEDTTDAFAVMHLRAGLALGERLRLEARLENLLDSDYNEHLTREALLPAGGLKPGDEVPNPGRRLVLIVSGRI